MHILIIDDEAAIRQILSALVSRAGYSVDLATTVAEATAKLVRGDVDVALCDVRLPDGDGIELVRGFKIAGVAIDTQFIMVTAFGSMETAVEALRAGATDYITKPMHSEELLHRLNQIEAMLGLRAENKALRSLVSGGRGRYTFSSPSMQHVDRMVSKVASTNSTVLLTGESGTGKGFVARLIHEQSLRAAHSLIPVNCSAIPENLMESEFFGHIKGAFTGADKARKGLLTEADRGTIFLDEIGDLPLHLQAKLLHVIEDKKIRPVGSEQTRDVDVRILAATNRNLEDMVKEGRFREDLYFRLSMFHIHIPPLRERRSDLPGLVRHLMRKAGEAFSGGMLEIDTEVESALQAYNWPGNVRQLENVIHRAYILADGGRITMSDLPPEISRMSLSKEASGGTIISGEGGLREQLRLIELEIIVQAINDVGGDRKAAAQKLGIGLSSLYRKMDELGASESNRVAELSRSAQ
jgi:DNA-binding NtrC family response regulator